MPPWPRFIDGLTRPHSQLSSCDDQLTARLFSSLTLAHAVMVAISILAANAIWISTTGSSIYDNLDFLVVAGEIGRAHV